MPTALTPELLRTMPLPEPEAGSKDARGSVLVVAGSPEVPGAAILAATAVLRAGAGKLQVATARAAALYVAAAVPEAMVLGLPEAPDGGLDHHAATGRLTGAASKVDAVLVGPGMPEGEPTIALTAALLAEPAVIRSGSVVLDAAALCGLHPHAEAVLALAGRAIIAPHAGEMAQLLGRSREAIEADPAGAARAAAALLGAVTIMKGAATHVVAPDGTAWLYEGGGVGLATSGSGDVLAGLLVGLLARGAAPAQAALWGVVLHGEAGRLLGERVGPLGFLARELAGEVPGLLRTLGGPKG